MIFIYVLRINWNIIFEGNAIRQPASNAENSSHSASIHSIQVNRQQPNTSIDQQNSQTTYAQQVIPKTPSNETARKRLFVASNDSEADDSSGLYTQKKNKRKNVQASLSSELMGGQRIHVEQALAITTETNSLLKFIISQNKTMINLLTALVEKSWLCLFDVFF